MKLSLVAAAALLATSAGLAQQHQNAYLYPHYDLPATDVVALDQPLGIVQEADASFWVTLWRFQGRNYGGYFGLQANGVGSGITRQAVFSIWNATAAEPNGAAIAVPFGGEGVGYSLRLPFEYQLEHYYMLSVERESVEANGVWWGAWITHLNGGPSIYLGRIRAAVGDEHLNGQSVENFSEYYGPQMPTCDDVPVSIVRFGLPSAHTGSGTVVGAYTDFARGACTGGSAALGTDTLPAPSPFRSAKGPFYLPNYVEVELGGPML